MAKGYPPYPPPPLPDGGGMYRNPNGTNPFPSPDNMPEPGWFGPKVGLTWKGTAKGNTNAKNDLHNDYRYAVWRSPLFDLRPGFRGVPASENIEKAGVTPIWRPYGSGGQLAVEMKLTSPVLGATFNDLNITAYDEANPWDPTQMIPITSEQDVTTRFTSSNQTDLGINGGHFNLAGIGFFGPPGGGGSPVRFWRMTLVLRFFLVHADPEVTVTAGYY